MTNEFNTPDGVPLLGGSGIKREYNKEIWALFDEGYTRWEIVEQVGCCYLTVHRHLRNYGRL